MRRRVALCAAAILAAALSTGPSHAASLVQLPDGGKNERCTTVQSCEQATLWYNHVRSARELAGKRITIITPYERGFGLRLDYHGEPLEQIIAHNGEHYGHYRQHIRTVARHGHHGVRYAAAHPHHARHLAARHHHGTTHVVTVHETAPATIVTTTTPIAPKEHTAARTPQDTSPDYTGLSHRVDDQQKEINQLKAALVGETKAREALEKRLAANEHASDAVEKKSALPGPSPSIGTGTTPPAGKMPLPTPPGTTALHTASPAPSAPHLTTTPASGLFMLTASGEPIVGGEAFPMWTLWIALATLVLLLALAGLGAYTILTAPRRRKARRTSAAPATVQAAAAAKQAPPASQELPRTVPFEFAPECIICSGQYEPTFEAVVTAKDPARIHTHGEKATKGNILLGYGPWDIGARNPGKPVSLGRETAAGTTYYTSSLTEMIASAVRGDADIDQGRAERIRAWLTSRELSINGKNPEIVVARKREYAKAA